MIREFDEAEQKLLILLSKIIAKQITDEAVKDFERKLAKKTRKDNTKNKKQINNKL